MNSASHRIPLLFSFAFRSLFLLLVLQAIIHIPVWFALWSGVLTIPVVTNPVYWHGHEMIVGFAGAAIAGFLLTAVATWTGRPQVRGWPLVVLCLSWLLARLGLFAPLLSAAAGIFFWIWLLALMTRELVSASNKRNYKILAILAVFLLLEVLYQFSSINLAPWQQQVVWSQIGLVLIMINLIGGRIIPAFTRNWMLRERSDLTEDQLPLPFGRVDIAATITLLLFFLSTLSPLADTVILALAVVCSVLQSWRLLRWKGFRCLSDPLVWMMHLSYAWIPLGILLVGLGEAGYMTISAGIHALAIGSVACMIVSVASRAALGHTGHPLVSHPLLTASIVLLALAAIARVGASISTDGVFLAAATTFWVAGFLCFAVRYVPILISPPVES